MSDPFNPMQNQHVADDVERDLALEMESAPENLGLGHLDDTPISRKSRENTNGMPRSLKIVAVVGGLVFSIIIIAAIASFGGRGRANEERAEAARRAAAASEVQAAEIMRADIAQQKEVLRNLQLGMKLLQEKVDGGGAAAKDLSALTLRVEGVEKALAGYKNDAESARLRALNTRPFEADMYIRDELRLLSVGNGLARIVDAAGAERTVRRGDKIDGLKVTNIRADRFQVTLSDGSIIQ